MMTTRMEHDRETRRLQRALVLAYDAHRAIPAGAQHDNARWRAWQDVERAEVRLADHTEADA